VPPELFDMKLRALRRDRTFRRGPELFLYDRAFDDCLDRLGLIQRTFHSALLIGCPNPEWPRQLRHIAEHVVVVDPGASFARAAGGAQILEDRLEAVPGAHDLCLAIGTLDTVNDLPQAFARVRLSLAADALFIGALSGADTLPQLRLAMRAADQVSGVAVPHVHPRLEASVLAALLSGAGFANPVVDVDRVQVSYETLDRLIHDLRAMGATNILSQRSRQRLSKAAYWAAAEAFSAAGDGRRTVETFEILHFAAWTTASGMSER
jgi:NADH dehydrogenase [ubiquinone] 1 alpha subcomplex assembly factor 5